MRSEKISVTEPVSQLRHIRIVENGEELVDFLEVCPDLMLDRARFHYRRETVMRRTLAEKLGEANRNLPSGYRLVIVEGWRAPHIQRRMYKAVWERFKQQTPHWSDVTLKRVVNRFTRRKTADYAPTTRKPRRRWTRAGSPATRGIRPAGWRPAPTARR